MNTSTETKPMKRGTLPPGARLYLLVGLPRGFEVHPIRPGTVMRIGRSRRCDVVIDHPSVSRVHVELHTDAPMRVVDLGSANGTRLRREPVPRERPRSVEVGDSITCGQVTLLIQRVSGATLNKARFELPHSQPPRQDVGSLHEEVAEVERRVIVETLFRCGGNQTRAANLLRISRGTLRSRMEAYGIPRPKASS